MSLPISVHVCVCVCLQFIVYMYILSVFRAQQSSRHFVANTTASSDFVNFIHLHEYLN